MMDKMMIIIILKKIKKTKSKLNYRVRNSMNKMRTKIKNNIIAVKP